VDADRDSVKKKLFSDGIFDDENTDRAMGTFLGKLCLFLSVFPSSRLLFYLLH
jgi:hypothetical protein